MQHRCKSLLDMLMDLLEAIIIREGQHDGFNIRRDNYTNLMIFKVSVSLFYSCSTIIYLLQVLLTLAAIRRFRRLMKAKPI